MAPSIESQEEELAGGFANAVNRGESLEQAKISFLNAGYDRQIVEVAAQQVTSDESGVSSESSSVSSAPASNLSLYATNDLSRPAEAAPVSKKRVKSSSRTGRFSNMPVPYWVVILMLLLSLAIVIGAGVLGLYWHRLFPG